MCYHRRACLRVSSFLFGILSVPFARATVSDTASANNGKHCLLLTAAEAPAKQIKTTRPRNSRNEAIENLKRKLNPRAAEVVDSLFKTGPGLATSHASRELFNSLLERGHEGMVKEAAEWAAVLPESERRLKFVSELWSIAYSNRENAGFENLYRPTVPHTTSLATEVIYYEELKQIIPRVGGKILEDRVGSDEQGIFVWQDESGNLYHYIQDHGVLFYGLENAVRDFAKKVGVDSAHSTATVGKTALTFPTHEEPVQNEKAPVLPSALANARIKVKDQHAEHVAKALKIFLEKREATVLLGPTGDKAVGYVKNIDLEQESIVLYKAGKPDEEIHVSLNNVSEVIASEDMPFFGSSKHKMERDHLIEQAKDYMSSHEKRYWPDLRLDLRDGHATTGILDHIDDQFIYLRDHFSSTVTPISWDDIEFMDLNEPF
jgi:hypothetical protein